jgi:uracil-DNA glycosylase
MEVKIAPGWKKSLEKEFNQAYFVDLAQFLKNEKDSKQIFYPPGPLIFNAFNLTDINQVKVVIIGQDPYHGDDQAHGLSFSVRQGIKAPPSLVNIYKELHHDLGIKNDKNLGDLSSWATQGVLLLNASLTVRANQPNSHAGIGWQKFTDKVIQLLNDEFEHLVFMLWGNFAKEKGAHIDSRKHLILKAAHPSPFSVEKGFFGCKHFSKANEYLMIHGKLPIDWMIK